MVDIITPQNKKDLLSAVSWSIATQSHMEIVGGGSKATLGRPTQNAAILDMSAFNSIREYDPTELFIKAGWIDFVFFLNAGLYSLCLLYRSPRPRDSTRFRMPSCA